MCGHNRSDKIRNENIQNKVGVAYVMDKMREVRLKWLDMSEQMHGCTSEEVREVGYKGTRRGKGRPRNEG